MLGYLLYFLFEKLLSLGLKETLFNLFIALQRLSCQRWLIFRCKAFVSLKHKRGGLKRHCLALMAKSG
jgi:hypothetical protein